MSQIWGSLYQQHQTSIYLNTKRNKKKVSKRKHISVIFRCQWCNKELQVTTHRLEKKRKDFCNIYCNRAYYDFKKRLMLKLGSSSLALFSYEMELKRFEMIEELTSNGNGKQLSEIFNGYSKIVRAKITKNKKLKRRLVAKRFLIINNVQKYLDEYDKQVLEVQPPKILHKQINR